MNKDLGNINPESIGFSSKWVEAFIDKMEQGNICLHSFLMIRYGKIGAEGYFKPFAKDDLHRMYSVTKSFVSIAIGMLVDEGKISLDDKVVDFFPNRLPKGGTHTYTAKATIRDLLMMATPFSEPAYTIKDEEWLNAFFIKEPTHPSGTIFNYDSSGTYVLGAIVKCVTGLSFLEYMRKDLLDNIGFSKLARCIEGPDGEAWSGSGLLATTRDLAKFTLLLLNKGQLDGKSLISEQYVRDATTKQIDNNTNGANYSWNCGYGYQFWILKDNAFCLNGMGGQLAICVPDKEFIFVCTADIQGNVCGKEVIYSALWSELINKLTTDLPEDKVAYDHLNKRCSDLKLPPIAGEKKSKIIDMISGKTYILNENQMQISKIKVDINGDEGILSYTNPRGDKKLYFGIGKYTECGFPETHYPGERLGRGADRMYKSTNCGAWVEEDKLVIRTYIIDDYIGNLTTTLSFKGENIGISMFKNAQFFLDEYNGFAGGTRI